MRNDFVTTALDVETINEITADAGGKIGPDLLHIQTERSDFVMVERDLSLGLIDFRIDVRESKHAGLHCFALNLFGELEDAVGISG